MLFAAAGLLLALYLPGALVLRVPVLERERRAALSAEERVYWAVVLSAAWTSLVTLGLAAAGQYSIQRLLLVNAAVSIAIVLGWRDKLRYGASVRPTAAALVPVALLGLGAVTFFPPAEYILGGKDPGVYINEGIQIGQRGSLVTRDAVVANVPPAARDLFFPSHEREDYYGQRFMGFFILDPAAGTVVGQFPHLYPAWVAIAYGLYGLNGALYALGGCALLGLLGVYFCGARLVGRTAAAVGAALLALSVVQVWFARYPNSELITQAFLFAALLAFARATSDDDVFFAPVSAVLLGLLLAARFDAVIALGAVGITLGLLRLAGRPLQAAFVGPLVLAVIGWAVYMHVVLPPYAARPLAFARNLGWQGLALAAGAVVALGAILALGRMPRAREIAHRWVPRVVVATVVAAAAYAFFFRMPGGRLATHDANSFRMFAWYLHPAGVAAAVLGFVIVGWRRFWVHPSLVVVTAVYGLVVFYKLQIVPEHFWLARRFVPVIMPAALLFAAAGILAGFRSQLLGTARSGGILARGDRFTRVAIRLVLLGLLAMSLARSATPILPHVEYAGLIPRIEALAGRFTDRDLLIVESRNASDLHVLALPLAYIYARNVLVLNTPKPDKAAFAEFLEFARTQYDRIYFIGGGGTDLLSRRIGVSVIASDRFQVPEFESLRNAYPTRVRHKEFDFGIYQFAAQGAPTGWFWLDVGTRDDLHVVRFHAKERNGERTYRWTRNVSYVSVVGMSAEASLLTLTLENGGRPPGEPPATVEVFLEDQRLGLVTVGPDARPYSFGIPPELAAKAAATDEAALLKLVSSTWNPKAALGVGDDRDLGVMVDTIEVR